MKTKRLHRFQVWLIEPAERTGQIIVEALDEKDAEAVALDSLFAVEWDEQEADSPYVSDVCRLTPDGEIDKKRIHERARESGYDMGTQVN